MTTSKHYCLICKHTAKSEEDIKAGTNQILYLQKGGIYHLHLCYFHSVEYYVKGQANFLSKYRKLVDNFCYQVDDPVREYLEKLEASLNLRKKSPWWRGDWFKD